MLSIDHYVHGNLHGSFQDNHAFLWRNKKIIVGTLQTYDHDYVNEDPCGSSVSQFLLLIFSCLRKAAWDYGRLALLMENDR